MCLVKVPRREHSRECRLAEPQSVRLPDSVPLWLVVSLAAFQSHKVTPFLAETANVACMVDGALRHTDAEAKISRRIGSSDLRQPWPAQVRVPNRGKTYYDRQLLQVNIPQLHFQPIIKIWRALARPAVSQMLSMFACAMKELQAKPLGHTKEAR